MNCSRSTLYRKYGPDLIVSMIRAYTLKAELAETPEGFQELGKSSTDELEEYLHTGVSPGFAESPN